MDQRMKPEPASPDQRVPSQSKTATAGLEVVNATEKFRRGKSGDFRG